MRVALPAHSLYGNQPVPVDFPDSWEVEVAAFAGAEEPALDDAAITEAILHPNHGKPICQAARGCPVCAST